MATQHDRAAIAAQLSLLEQELKELELWGGAERRPSAEELASSLPFAMDTLEFHQWLEYILIERLRTQLATALPLPTAMMVHSFAQEAYRGQWGKYRRLIALLRELDELITLEQA